jgi:hypothetical protein
LTVSFPGIKYLISEGIRLKLKTLIDGITKHSQKLQNEIELERKTVKQTFCDLKRQADQAEKTIILHQDEIMAALKSIQGSTFHFLK